MSPKCPDCTSNVVFRRGTGAEGGTKSASSRYFDRPSHRWEGGSTDNMTDGSTGSKEGSFADDATGKIFLY